ncbi:secondary thiamine-phosphate synthase enzyme YjbQ [Massilia sp. CFBP9012]|uniref:secondary thiamine-phosphate synthase enzyme YjbQ n=1 Tax=Massilia sp. CFBP9012 TaxID=3096531 RepID=UPI002A69BE3E|nr:secondary thiamine-phosphate synthase enzyme YjbQ [Massilia sp. CFBP9012]MDY0973576.1 secondary thiamine-phosphate synthase enzyme YjbQ [Massilia sp. CFBP9012]
MAHQTILEFSTSGRGTREITRDVAAVVAASRLQCGLVQVFVQHTSCSLLLTENADGDVRRDLETIISRLAPDGDPAYRHDAEGPDDMSAHGRTMLTDTALTIPVGAGRMLLGTWQGIYLWEHRTAPHRRRVVVTVLGG